MLARCCLFSRLILRVLFNNYCIRNNRLILWAPCIICIFFTTFLQYVLCSQIVVFLLSFIQRNVLSSRGGHVFNFFCHWTLVRSFSFIHPCLCHTHLASSAYLILILCLLWFEPSQLISQHHHLYVVRDFPEVVRWRFSFLPHTSPKTLALN